MAAKQVDLLRMRVGSSPSITRAITRPNISFIHTPFGSLRIRDSGGPLPSILFACDAPNVIEHYDAIFTLLASTYRLICIEMPGFGFSYPSATFDFSMRQYVDAVVSVIEALNCDGGGGSVTLMFPCAWSYTAFQLATERPALVERLIVSQCPCWAESQAWSKRIDSGGVMRTPILGQLFLAANQKRISDGWYHVALPKGSSTQEFAAPARKVLADGGIFCLASLLQTWSLVKDPQFHVEAPTVIMWGGADRTHRFSNPDSTLPYLKRGAVVRCQSFGHFPELEDPEGFKALLLDEKLWNGLRAKNTESVYSATEAGVDEKPSDHSVSNDAAQHRTPIAERRRPLDSHL